MFSPILCPQTMAFLVEQAVLGVHLTVGPRSEERQRLRGVRPLFTKLFKLLPTRVQALYLSLLYGEQLTQLG